jgi:hypothetical protein
MDNWSAEYKQIILTELKETKDDLAYTKRVSCQRRDTLIRLLEWARSLPKTVRSTELENDTQKAITGGP